MLTALLLLLACAPAVYDTSASTDTSDALTVERVEADCAQLVYHNHFLIVAVDDPDAVIEWSSLVSSGDAWTNVPEAVVLYDNGVFVLAGATYCPSGETLRLTWLW